MRTLCASTSSASTRSSLCCGGLDDNQEPHFLDSCSLCSKPLYDSDIFMYRGNTPFCSKECRQEQIDSDEACERQKWKRSSSSKAAARSSVNRSSERKADTVAVV